MSRLARLGFLVAALSVCALTPQPVRAQEPALDTPAHISFVDGTAALERDGRNESAPTSMPLLAGDRVRTSDGRVEILYADGSTLHLDGGTLVDFQSDEVVRLLGGRVRLSIAGANRRVGFRVDAPSAWIDITTAGEYRIAVLSGDEVELAVLRGRAELVNEDGRTALGAGERAFARAGAIPSAPYVYNSAAWDNFDRWSESRRDTRLGVASEYLPDTVQPYAATFNQYGYWQNVATYGHVWYPRVRPGWRPYYYGRWTTLRPWGWTWIGADPWAWPTHHFGRWGFSAGSWFWIPGRTWGPAHVSWGYAPGYVSWCPLGWNNLPVFSFVNVNVFGGHRYDRWHAWTVVPHHGFGRGFVNVHSVNAARLDVNTRRAFVARDIQPDFRGYAVPRSSAPIRTAVSRDGAFGAAATFRGSRTAPGASAQVGSDPAAAFRGSRAAPGASAQVGSDSAAAFRSRRSGSTPVTGPGYPAPARQPNLTAPARERTAPSTISPDRQGGVRSRGSASPSISSDPASAAARRAVPRSAPANTAPAPGMTTSPSQPSRRSAPEYRAVPSPGETAPDPQPYRSPERSYPGGGASRAVPRSSVESYSPPAGVQRERNPNGAASGANSEPQRAMPRSNPYSAPPDRGESSYRPRGGVERSAPSPSPSSPPPAAAPPRSYERSSPGSGASSNSGGGGGDRAGSSAGSRSRGDAGSSGRAVPRGRGGK